MIMIKKRIYNAVGIKIIHCRDEFNRFNQVSDIDLISLSHRGITIQSYHSLIYIIYGSTFIYLVLSHLIFYNWGILLLLLLLSLEFFNRLRIIDLFS
jgi:hypothetical protein